MNAYKLNDQLFYVGVNDRHKHLFENMLPLPYGVSYNSYLLVDEKVVLVDTVEAPFSELLLANIRQVIGDRAVDYLIVNHMEPDHSSSINAIKSVYPDIKIVGNAKTISMLQGYYGLKDGFHEVKEGDALSIGSINLRFYFAPMVHWPEVMVTYDETNAVLFSADAFGCFGTLDGAVLDVDLNLDKYYKEMYRYYANIVGKYGVPVQQALKKLGGLKLDMICSTHGPVWTKHMTSVIAIYDKLSKYEGEDGVVVVYGSMYGHTEQMAESVARGAMKVTKNVVVHDVSKTDVSEIVSDIFKYKALIVGSPTYCNALYPGISSLIEKLELRGLKNRTFGAFGNFTWAGVSIKTLSAFADRMNWNMVGSVEVKQGISADDCTLLMEMGQNVGQAMLQQDDQ